MFLSMVSCLFAFNFSGNVNLSQDCIMLDDLAIETSLSIVIKNLNNKVNFSERASCGAVKTLSALSAISGGLRTGD